MIGSKWGTPCWSCSDERDAAVTRLVAGSATDIGRRQINQDRVLLTDDGHLFAVADGMGGHRRGEVAAEMAVAHLAGHMHAEDSLEHLVTAISDANRTVFEASSNNPDLQGMGTTLTALAVIQDDGETRLAIANVGDSRTYLLRSGELEQLTEDHSMVAEMVREGHLSVEGARTHRQRSVLTRALGVEPHVEADIIEVLPSIGDRYLLCSDGLCGEVTDEQTASVLRRLANPDEAARELVRLALTSGGSDNISVIVIDVVDDDNAAQRASAGIGGEGVNSTRVIAPSPMADGSKRGARSQRAARTTTRSRIVTWRTLMFMVLLGALATIAVLVIRNAPGDETPSVTTIVAPTTIAPDPFAPVSSVLGGSIPPSTSTSSIATSSIVPSSAGGPTTSTR